MNGKLLRMTALLLAVLMLVLPLAACSKTENNSAENGTNASESGNKDNSGNKGNKENAASDDSYKDFVYTAAYQKLTTDEEIQNLDQLTYANGRLYMIAWMVTGKVTEYYDEDWNLITDEEKIANGEYAQVNEYDQTEPALCSANPDGSDFKRLENFEQTSIPEGSQGSSYINSLCVDGSGNIWVYEEMYAWHYDENGTYFDDGNQYLIRKLDETGATLVTVDLSQIYGEQQYFYVNNFLVDASGMLYITGGEENGVYVVDETGAMLCTVPLENGSINQLVRLKDGTVAAMYYSEGAGSYVLSRIDTAAKAFGDDLPVPSNIYYLINGGGDYDYYYNDGYSLYGYQIETETATQLVNWINSDINSDELQSIIPLDDGRIIGISSSWQNDRTNVEVVTLTKADPSTIPEKEILTFACMWLNYDVRAKIIEFNKASDRYRINVVDYSTFNTEDDYTAGQTKLTTEIISGKVPDILATSGLPINRYIARGLLEDLKPYIESDPELGTDAIVPGALRALEVNGGIYQAASCFSIETVIGAEKIVGDKMGWTVSDLKEALTKMPEGAIAFCDTTRDNLLYYICSMNQSNYVDWETGKCDFNNEEFIQLLEFVKTFPAEINYDDNYEYVSMYKQIMEGKVMLANTTVADFDEFQVYKQVFGGDITFVGFPTSSGSGSIAQFSDGLAISSTCANKDAAWSFVRYLFTEEYQTEDYYGWSFPTNQKAFDQMVAQAMEKQMGTDENGNEVEISHGSWWIDDGIEVEMYAATQEDVDQIVELINNASGASAFDQDIYNIISEEAQAFFEGQKTAQDVAAIIQSRASIYVNEQR